jgi:prepilin-type N-terminal cleavage/methylation domain-containing protein
MNRDAIVLGVSRSRGRAAKRGYTLVEALVVMVIMSVLVAMGIPRFQQSLEQSRADVAGASLRSIWSAQRLYWLQYRTYAPDLPTLQSANLIDPSLTTATAPYTYQVAAASDSSFTATATRSGSSFWAGTFTIAADGTFSGSIQQSGQGPLIVPSYQ